MARSYSDYSSALQIDGLPDFITELRGIDTTLPHQVQVAHKKVLAFVLERAGNTARSQGPAGVREASAMSGTATQRGATIKLDGVKVPGALGEEFGSYHDRLRDTSRGLMKGWNQFRTWRSKAEGAGYALWPTIRDGEDAIAAFYDEAMGEVLARAFPD